MSRVRAVAQHLARVLGPPALDTAARHPASGEAAGFRVLSFADRPVDGAFTLVTAGLGERALEGPDGSVVREELLLCAWDEHRGDALLHVLFSVGAGVLEEGVSVDPGDVYELAQPLAPGSELRHLFVHRPLYHPDEIQPVSVAGGEVEICWLIPVTAGEAGFVEERGPEAFDDLLFERDPDLLDLHRDSVA